jgi:hypothetical protein
MSILLYVVGAILVAIGAALIGFGIPINEFSFGNTLIVAGTVAMVGGFIVFALGVVVRTLQHVAEASSRNGARHGRPTEVETAPPLRASSPGAARAPFPPKPKGPSRGEAAPRAPAEPGGDLHDDLHDDLPPPFPVALPRTVSRTPPMAPPVAAPVSAHLQPRPEEEVFGAPALPNPDEPPVFAQQEKPVASGPREFEPRLPPLLPERDADGEEPEREPRAFAIRRSVSPPTPASAETERSYFDSMWPAEPPFEPASDELKATAVESHESAEAAAEPGEPDVDSGAPADEPRTVPILKSGVVDGMGYTLYVDGSIEAELPQGTLRFASINELRAHLEKTS